MHYFEKTSNITIIIVSAKIRNYNLKRNQLLTDLLTSSVLREIWWDLPTGPAHSGTDWPYGQLPNAGGGGVLITSGPLATVKLLSREKINKFSFSMFETNVFSPHNFFDASASPALNTPFLSNVNGQWRSYGGEEGAAMKPYLLGWPLTSHSPPSFLLE